MVQMGGTINRVPLQDCCFMFGRAFLESGGFAGFVIATVGNITVLFGRFPAHLSSFGS